jgi:hypothetical protein
VEGCCKHDNEAFGFRNMLGNSWGAAKLAASHEGLSSVKYLVIISVTYSK